MASPSKANASRMDNKLGQLETRMSLLSVRKKTAEDGGQPQGKAMSTTQYVSSAAARVFAIPELLENILLQLDLHTKGRFRISSAGSAMQLCRLEKVNRLFCITLRTSLKLRLQKEKLFFNGVPHEHATVIWLLRELGHLDFTRADCKAFGCTQYNHRCGGAGLEVGRTSESLTAEYKARFKETVSRMYPEGSDYMPCDGSWRSLRIANPLMIYYKSRRDERQHILSNETTLGGLWDAYASKL